jgi:hypothetical protein
MTTSAPPDRDHLRSNHRVRGGQPAIGNTYLSEDNTSFLDIAVGPSGRSRRAQLRKT